MFFSLARSIIPEAYFEKCRKCKITLNCSTKCHHSILNNTKITKCTTATCIEKNPDLHKCHRSPSCFVAIQCMNDTERK